MPKQRLSQQNMTAIIIASIGVIGSVVVSYFAFRGNTVPIELSISTTQTAEARLTTSAIPTTLLQIANASDTPFPSETPSLATQSPINPTETLPPEKILFHDDFTSNVNGWKVGKRTLTFTKQDLEFINGQYQFSAIFDAEAFTWINAPDLSVKNFYLSVDTKVAQYTKHNEVGIVIAFRYGFRGENTYAVVFNNDSTFSFHVKENEVWREIYQGDSTAFQIQEGAYNTFALKVYGQRFTAYANGQELHTLDDTTITDIGEIGLGAHGQEGTSLIIAFDNLLITENSNP